VTTIRVETIIGASIEVCFDLSRSLRAHVATTSNSKERVVSQHEQDLLGLDDAVTFEAVHFGVRQRLTSRIVAFEYPRSFSDQMLNGAFKSLRHDHLFDEFELEKTKMIDVLTFESPFGFVGKLVDRLFLRRYMEKFIRERGLALKSLAERT